MKVDLTVSEVSLSRDAHACKAVKLKKRLSNAQVLFSGTKKCTGKKTFKSYQIENTGFFPEKSETFVRQKEIPIDPFTTFEPQIPEINKVYVLRKRRSTDFKALKL